MGEGKTEKAKQLFSLFVYVTIAFGVVLTVASFILLPTVAKALGAEGTMLTDCVTYGRIIVLALPMFMLQFEFQSFFVTAEKPGMGLWVTVISGFPLSQRRLWR